MKGKRIIITLPEKDKLWLESYSKAKSVSIAEAIRRGIERVKSEEGPSTYRTLVESTQGIWKKGDGLAYQRTIRSEWNSQ